MKRKKESAIKVDYQAVTKDEGESSQVSSILKRAKQSQGVTNNSEVIQTKFENDVRRLRVNWVIR